MNNNCISGVHSSEGDIEQRKWKKRPKKNKKPLTRSTYQDKIQRPESWLSTCFNFNHYRLHRVGDDGKIVGDRFVVDIDGRPNPLHALNDDGSEKYPGMKLFDRHIELFDGAFYCATYSHDGEGIQRRYVRNCAGLVGELLDQNGDGKIDDDLLAEKLKENRAHIAIVEKVNSEENTNEWLRLVFKTMQSFVVKVTGQIILVLTSGRLFYWPFLEVWPEFVHFFLFSNAGASFWKPLKVVPVTHPRNICNCGMESPMLSYPKMKITFGNSKMVQSIMKLKIWNFGQAMFYTECIIMIGTECLRKFYIIFTWEVISIYTPI